MKKVAYFTFDAGGSVGLLEDGTVVATMELPEAERLMESKVRSAEAVHLRSKIRKQDAADSEAKHDKEKQDAKALLKAIRKELGKE